MISQRSTRRQLLLGLSTACAAASLPVSWPDSRSFWVLKLLKPAALRIRPLGNARLHCSVGATPSILEGAQSLVVRANREPVHVAGPDGSKVGCVLEIPEVIQRAYFGTVDISTYGGVLIPVVRMDAETATGSIVAAELPVFSVPLGALAAQAVAARSILLVANSRHPFADFCDTTHCQFMRSPAAPGSMVERAIRQTTGMVLSCDGNVIPARYSAACGGRTESGIDHGYRYESVVCETCQALKLERRGHGWGLCQEGAIGLARRGWTWRAILDQYYPNTRAIQASFTT